MARVTKNLLITNNTNPEFETISNAVIQGKTLNEIKDILKCSKPHARKLLTFYGLYPYYRDRQGSIREEKRALYRLRELKKTITWELYQRFLSLGYKTEFKGRYLFVEDVRVKVAGPRIKEWFGQIFYTIPFDSDIRIYAVKTLKDKWIFYLPYVKRRNRRILWLNKSKEDKPETFPSIKDIEILKLVWRNNKTFLRLKNQGLFEEGGEYGRFREASQPNTNGSEREYKWPWGKANYVRPQKRKRIF